MESNSHQGLLVIQASAGSGKTFTLALRYIELLLFEVGNDGLKRFRRHRGYHKHILAITFTNKATQEMKERIVNELFILATDVTRSHFYAQFKENSDEYAPHVLDAENLQDAARRALASIVFHYGDFNVSTIDSFFQSILRNFARELDRDYNYEVQIDDDFALREALHNFLLGLGTDSHRIRSNGSYRMSDVELWVRDLIKLQVQDDRSWNFFREDGDLINFAKTINKEVFREHMQEVQAYLSSEGKPANDFSRIRQFRAHVIEAARQQKAHYTQDLHDMLPALLGDEMTSLYKGRKVWNFFQADGLRQGKEPKDFLGLATGGIDGQVLKSMSLEGRQHLLDWCREVQLTWTKWQLLDNLAHDLGIVGLLGQISQKLLEYTQETNSVLIADTNDLIARVLDSGVPFIYERTGTLIKHFMIDEFQDTSRKQYGNFKPLLEEGLAQNRENLSMVIGDTKQSIYRFRNADVSLFRDHVGMDFNAVPQNLDTNYRSAPTVVHFNNWIFEKLLADFPQYAMLQGTYLDPRKKIDYKQKTHHDEVPGFVSFHFNDIEGQPIKNKTQVLEALPQYLLELHRRFSWGSIGILVDRVKEGTEVVQRIMRHNTTATPEELIAVVSDEAMMLANSPAVCRIVSMLRFVELTQYHLAETDVDAATPKNAANKQRAGAQRLYYIMGHFMELLANDSTTPPGELLVKSFRAYDQLATQSEVEQMNFFATCMTDILPNRETELMSLDNIVEKIIARFLLTSAPECHEQETLFLLAFQDCVHDFASRSNGGGTLREFLRYWDAESEKISVPGNVNLDAINVLTIHKSKGLEFDCVVIPFADWSLMGSRVLPSDKTSSIYWVTRSEWVAQKGLSLTPNLADEGLVPPLIPVVKKHLKSYASLRGDFSQLVNREEESTLIDGMNKTYVAFTRPREELHVFAKTGRGKVSELLQQHFMLAAGQPHPDLTAQEIRSGVYQCGEPRRTPKHAHALLNGRVEPMPPYKVTQSSRQVVVKLPREITDKQLIGNRLHNLMSRIFYRRDVERAIHFCLNRGIISREDPQWPLARIRRMLVHMFEDHRTSVWFRDDNRVYNERNVYSPEKTRRKRPDRVVRRPNGDVLVVDYKFGQEDLADNVKQVRGYMTDLHAAGMTHVVGFLWYVTEDKVYRVTPQDVQEVI